MSKKAIDYSKCKIYRIIPTVEHPEEDVYIGSTCQNRLSERFAHHRTQHRKNKQNQTTARVLFDKYGVENCTIELIELYKDCSCKEERDAREAHYIRNTPCVNKCIPGRTYAEYYQDNRDRVCEQHKRYRENNPDAVREQHNQYYDNNRQAVLKRNKRYREINAESIKAKKREYYQLNSESIQAKRREKRREKKEASKNI